MEGGGRGGAASSRGTGERVRGGDTRGTRGSRNMGGSSNKHGGREQ